MNRVSDAAEKAAVRLSVALAVEGGQASDGAYHARSLGRLCRRRASL